PWRRRGKAWPRPARQRRTCRTVPGAQPGGECDGASSGVSVGMVSGLAGTARERSLGQIRDAIPVRLEAEAGLVVQLDPAVPGRGQLLVDLLVEQHGATVVLDEATVRQARVQV